MQTIKKHIRDTDTIKQSLDSLNNTVLTEREIILNNSLITGIKVMLVNLVELKEQLEHRNQETCE